MSFGRERTYTVLDFLFLFTYNEQVNKKKKYLCAPLIAYRQRGECPFNK